MTTRVRVDAADAAWWSMDRPENPMMITGILWFDGPIDTATIRTVLSERLVARYPKFAMRIVHDRAWPMWEPDPNFDIDAHLHRSALPAPGGKAQMEALVAQRMSTRLDPDAALWHADLIEGFESGPALVMCIHHVLADGISLARVLLGLADGAAEPVPEPRPSVGLAQEGAWLARRAAAIGSGWLNDPSELADAARRAGGAAMNLAHLIAMPPDPPSVIRGELGARKVAAWMAPLPLDRVKALGRRLDATVNDVLLAALALGLGAYLRSRGDRVHELRTFVPVNLRPLDRPVPRELGNQFGLVLLGLPVGLTDPRVCLTELKRRMDTIKDSPEALITFAVLQAMAGTPDVFERWLIDFFGAKVSMITTNVPGPRTPVKVGGVTVAGLLFWVPQSASVGLGISIISYAGQVRVAVAGDAHRIPDPNALVAAYEAAFARLEESAGGA